MAKKTRISDDAFEWVKETSKPATKPGTATKKETIGKTKPISNQNNKNPISTGDNKKLQQTDKKRFFSGRRVFVEYDKGGKIVSVLEINPNFPEPENHPIVQLDESMSVAKVSLTSDVENKRIIDIIKTYKVKRAGKTVSLVHK